VAIPAERFPVSRLQAWADRWFPRFILAVAFAIVLIVAMAERVP